ncbi:MAG: hypothetical protein AB7P76_04795 [Candidatus Melainabacteria bacterium]
MSIPPANLSRAYSALKVLDQPRLLQKLSRLTLPAIPVAGAAVVAAQTLAADPADRKKTLLRQGTTVGVTALASAFAARRFLMKPQELEAGLKAVQHEARQLLSRLADQPDTHVLQGLVRKAADQVLKPGDIHELRTGLLNHLKGDKARAEALFEKLVPTPAGETGRAMLTDIKNLSLMGLFPVLGGVAGGALGNIVSGEPWRKKLKNQAQEGAFQYLANIVLCNFGAAAALGALELTSKNLAAQRMPRLIAMTAGIVGMGIVGGSAIANVIGNNLISPLIQQGPAGALKQLKTTLQTDGLRGLTKNLYQERHPEPLDAALHADDMMVAGQLAGLQWMGSILPLLYGVSALRSAAGYRNGHPDAGDIPPDGSGLSIPMAATAGAGDAPVTRTAFNSAAQQPFGAASRLNHSANSLFDSFQLN